jgi:hypothetical protein
VIDHKIIAGGRVHVKQSKVCRLFCFDGNQTPGNDEEFSDALAQNKGYLFISLRLDIDDAKPAGKFIEQPFIC